MVRTDDRAHESTVVDPWISAQVARATGSQEPSPASPRGCAAPTGATPTTVPPSNSIWALITRILCPRVGGGEQIRWPDREVCAGGLPCSIEPRNPRLPGTGTQRASGAMWRLSAVVSRSAFRRPVARNDDGVRQPGEGR